MHKRELTEGDYFTAKMPWSEVCMYMGVADRVMVGKVGPRGWSVQLIDDDGRSFSFPITTGEAGVYHDDGGGLYVYDLTPQGVCA